MSSPHPEIEEFRLSLTMKDIVWPLTLTPAGRSSALRRRAQRVRTVEAGPIGVVVFIVPHDAGAAGVSSRSLSRAAP